MLGDITDWAIANKRRNNLKCPACALVSYIDHHKPGITNGLLTFDLEIYEYVAFHRTLFLIRELVAFMCDDETNCVWGSMEFLIIYQRFGTEGTLRASA